MKIISIISGGMDSATLAYDIAKQGYEQIMLSFNYGQRHIRELQSAHAISVKLSCEHRIIDLTAVGKHLKGSALTDDIAVPHGHYAEESMRQTVVPNRNAIMLSIAWGVAVAENAVKVATAVHSGDHYIYPDCRPEFITALTDALRLATVGHRHNDLQIYAPYLNISKTDICAIGAQLGVPYEMTYTCYEGGDIHCGQCGACVERQEAFRDSGTPDPTQYRQPVAA